MRNLNIKVINNEEQYLRAIKRIESLQDIDCELMTEKESNQLFSLTNLVSNYEKSIFSEIIEKDINEIENFETFD